MTINERVGNNIRKYRIAHHYTLRLIRTCTQELFYSFKI